MALRDFGLLVAALALGRLAQARAVATRDEPQRGRCPVTAVDLEVADPESGLDAATVAAKQFLEALGVSTDGPGLRESPARMARAYAEMLTPRSFELTTFPNDEKYDELVVVKDIPVQSLCEHHLLPFTGVAHIGYLPGERILGLSKFARVVELFARRPQVQERLTQQVATWLDDQLGPQGRRRGDRGRAQLHVAARCAGRRRRDPDLGADRHAAQQPGHPPRVPRRAARRTRMTVPEPAATATARSPAGSAVHLTRVTRLFDGLAAITQVSLRRRHRRGGLAARVERLGQVDAAAGDRDRDLADVRRRHRARARPGPRPGRDPGRGPSWSGTTPGSTTT